MDRTKRNMATWLVLLRSLSAQSSYVASNIGYGRPSTKRYCMACPRGRKHPLPEQETPSVQLCFLLSLVNWLWWNYWDSPACTSFKIKFHAFYALFCIVSVKVKVKVTPEQATKAHSGYRYDSTLSLTSAIDGVEWPTPSPGRFAPGKDPVSITQEAGWIAGPVWVGAEYLSLIMIRSPDRPARSQSLYRMSYPRRHIVTCTAVKL